MSVSYKETQTSSESALDLALPWINNCLDHHSKCKQLQEKEAWWPTRLIDIGYENNGLWKIVSLPRKLQPPPVYTTLSYRWGANVKLQLSKENKNSFLDGLPIATLPRTFQDAILVARKFSVRYLWIDALCIVQNCSEDWDRESKSMRLVYTNALCNLAAVASSDPNGGLFRTRNPEILRPSVVRGALDMKTPPKRYYAVDSEFAQRQVLDTELIKRGWVFQERLLCPRVLYFAEEQVFWECFVEQKCETFPNGIALLTSSKAKDLSIIIKLKDRVSTADKEQRSQVTGSWEKLVEEYTKCKLTKASDKLSAMEGIADLFRACFHDEYVFGLWRTNLVQQLAYFVRSPWPESSSGCAAPSWAWASLQSPVMFPSRSRTTTQYTQLLDLVPLQGILRLRGHVIRAKTEGARGCVELIAGCSQTFADIYPDSRGVEVNMPGNIIILPLLSYDHVRGTKLDCLVLEPILVTTAKSYRRIEFLTAERGQDLAFYGVTILKDGSGKIEEEALSDINLM